MNKYESFFVSSFHPTPFSNYLANSFSHTITKQNKRYQVSSRNYVYFFSGLHNFSQKYAMLREIEQREF